LGRLGKADEIGQVAAFLSSPAADYITGETVIISGGWVID
jgi:NAD(P)-dependent dehydrogenase (short-subunit alcohol dehydrogenase family)